MPKSRSFRRRKNNRGWQIVAVGAGAIIVTVLVVLALNPPTPETSTANPQSSTPTPTAEGAWADGTLKLGIVGDSLTAGWMADSEATTYREQVRAAEYSGALELAYVATPGATSATMQAQAAEVIAGAEVVLIATGTNDTSAQPDLSVLNAEYPALLAAVPDDKTLFCLGPWLRDTASNAAMKTMCETAGGTFISLADLSNLRGPAGAEAFPQVRDNFHPNQAGHDAIASRVIAAIS